MNDPALVPLVPGSFTTILPVTAPVGTVAVIDVAEFMVKLVASTPPNVTAVAPSNPVPVIATCEPTGPLVGDMFVTVGMTWNLRLLLNAAVGVVTVTNPATALAGTIADK